MKVIVVGGGIGGLSLALSLHQAGIAVRVYESVDDPIPVGLGINLQPTAVRELTELGLGDVLAQTASLHSNWLTSTNSANSFGTSLAGCRLDTGGRNTRSIAANCSYC